ncbi:MAG: glycosyltransferase, partial [Desulfosarcinaceae bacterium]
MRSVLEQDYPRIEYILMDGGSTDGSQEIIAKYSQRLAHWQSQSDGGHYAAVEAGLRKCRGDILTWLNADDFFHPLAFRQAAAIFLQRPEVHWITGRPNNYMNKKGSLFILPRLPLWSRQRYLDGNYKSPFIQQEGTFWRRALWEKAGARLAKNLKLAADLELWARFFRHAQLFSVDATFAAYRVHRQNRASRFMARYLAEAEQIIAREKARRRLEYDRPMHSAPVPITSRKIKHYMHACISKIGKSNPIDSRIGEGSQPVEATADQPLITAVVSAYNSERFMRGCIEDLLAQTIADRLEIIIIDSASPQNEGAIVHEFQQHFDNIKYIRTSERETVYQAWNRGIKLAVGKYITNANTDDRHRHDALEQMVRVLDEDESVALVYADVIKTHHENQTFGSCNPTGVLRWYPWNRDTLLEKGCFIGPQPVWRRSLHDEFGYFEEHFSIAADYEFWLRISQIYDFRHINIPLGLYLERQDSIEHVDADEKRRQDVLVNRRYREALAAKRVLGYRPFEDLRKAVQARKTKPALLALQQTSKACRQRWGQKAGSLLAG